MSKILDLSKPQDWLKVAENVAKEVVPKHLISRLRDSDHDEMYSDKLSFLAGVFDEEWDGGWELSERLTEDFETRFLKHYTHIRAFHACRPFLGPDSYLKEGIRKASKNLIRELAHSAFGNRCEKAEIDQAVDDFEISDSDKAVWLFTDRWNATRDIQNHYLQSGSEILQALTQKLGLYNRGHLASQSFPCLIECRIPIEDVSPGFKGELWRNLITLFFKYAAGRPKLTQPMDFCIRVIEDVSPGSIVKIHSLRDEELKYGTDRH